MKRNSYLLLLIISSTLAVLAYFASNGTATWRIQLMGNRNSEQTNISKSPEGKAQLSGKVMHKSDVATIPDFPYSAGAVLAIPAERWDELMSRVGLHGALQYVQFAIGRGTFDEFVVAATTIDSDGSYRLSLRPSHYVICVGNLTGPPPDPEAYPVSINGCLGPVMVEGNRKSIEISFGEGGVIGR